MSGKGKDKLVDETIKSPVKKKVKIEEEEEEEEIENQQEEEEIENDEEEEEIEYQEEESDNNNVDVSNSSADRSIVSHYRDEPSSFNVEKSDQGDGEWDPQRDTLFADDACSPYDYTKDRTLMENTDEDEKWDTTTGLLKKKKKPT